MGARQHPRSGAGRIKDDGSDDERIYEIKDARKSFTLKAADLLGLHQRALRQGKTGVFIVHFSDVNLTAEVVLR